MSASSTDIVEISVPQDPELEQAIDRGRAPAPDPAMFGFGSIPLFASISEPGFRKLVKKLRIVSHAPGETVFQQGSRGSSMYILSEGAVRVVRDGATGPRSRTELAKLDAGEFFGEISRVTDQPRSPLIVQGSRAPAW